MHKIIYRNINFKLRYKKRAEVTQSHTKLPESIKLIAKLVVNIKRLNKRNLNYSRKSNINYCRKFIFY